MAAGRRRRRQPQSRASSLDAKRARQELSQPAAAVKAECSVPRCGKAPRRGASVERAGSATTEVVAAMTARHEGRARRRACASYFPRSGSVREWSRALLSRAAVRALFRHACYT